MDTYRLSASEAMAKIQAGEMTVEEYVKALLARIKKRDGAVKAWAYLDPNLVIQQAKSLDRIPMDQRGPLHGMAIGVKDVIYTKDMPTQHNSPIYKDSFPQVDSGSIMTLRHAGAIIFGKTTTTEFAATTVGPGTRNAHDSTRTPGGSSSGSGAAVGDLQVPIALGTQTGGSTIRPGSYNGVYAFKPTWGAITREGQKVYSLTLDTLGLYARSVDDLMLLADVFDMHDDVPSPFSGTKGAKFAICKTVVWPQAEEGTIAAMEKAVELLRIHGAEVEEVDVPYPFEKLPRWHRLIMFSEGRHSFLPESRIAKDSLHHTLISHAENKHGFTHKQYIDAVDSVAALRPVMDQFAGRYAALITPSVVGEAPVGWDKTGSASFNSCWTALHMPVVNIPGFKGDNGMPVGISLVAPRYYDRHLLKVSEAVGAIFESEGGWRRREL